MNTNKSTDQGENRLSRWKQFRLVVKVVELRLRFIAILAITGLVFAYWDTIWNYVDKWNREKSASRHVASVDVEYYCPMHPSVIRDEPGSCPICGMPLSKRKKGEKMSLPDEVLARVQLAPYRIKQAGIQTVEVGYEPLVETVTTVGYVDYDERRLANISNKIPGRSRIEKLYVNFTGVDVKEGEKLAELYSPELYQAERELLVASERAKRKPGLGGDLLGSSAEMVDIATEKLRLWGITPKQIDEILTKKKASFVVPIVAPIHGHVVKKNIVEGQYLMEGDAIFEIADLSRVWVQAKVYADQVGLIRIGQAVDAGIEGYSGLIFPGTVAFMQPHLDATTRTIDVRFDLDNPGHVLRPNMFANVTIKTPIVDTPAFQKHHAIMKYDHVGTISFKTADDQKICPVTTLKLGSMGAPIPIKLSKNRQIWTCCPACPPKFAKNPGKYLARLEPAPQGMTLAIPDSAVIDTGNQKIVYVESEPGVFDARSVILGPRLGDKYPVLEGLEPGVRIAATGAFLVDAESRLNPAATGRKIKGEPSSAAPAMIDMDMSEGDKHSHHH